MAERAGRREEILEAAFAEFAAKGFKGATIKGIALRAKLQSQALIYWYFPTKEALFQELLARRLPVLQVVLDADHLSWPRGRGVTRRREPRNHGARGRRKAGRAC